jgi:hypothetical protein
MSQDGHAVFEGDGDPVEGRDYVAVVSSDPEEAFAALPEFYRRMHADFEGREGRPIAKAHFVQFLMEWFSPDGMDGRIETPEAAIENNIEVDTSKVTFFDKVYDYRFSCFRRDCIEMRIQARMLRMAANALDAWFSKDFVSPSSLAGFGDQVARDMRDGNCQDPTDARVRMLTLRRTHLGEEYVERAVSRRLSPGNMSPDIDVEDLGIPPDGIGHDGKPYWNTYSRARWKPGDDDPLDADPGDEYTWAVPDPGSEFAD